MKIKLSRELTSVVNFIFDQLLPPILRDSRWFMAPLFRLALGKQFGYFFWFKDQSASLSKQELQRFYEKTSAAHIQRDTDLNEACVNKIQESILGDEVLDIACGRGFLAKILSANYHVVGADFVLPDERLGNGPQLRWDVANVESLHYKDDQFDTVICAHTLEHVLGIDRALQELRRVAKKRLILVLPRQRPYQYTFDLHVHFFYYKWQVELLIQQSAKGDPVFCELVGGDWLYIEDLAV